MNNQRFFFDDDFEPLEEQVTRESFKTDNLIREIDKIDNEISKLSERIKILKMKKNNLLNET